MDNFVEITEEQYDAICNAIRWWVTPIGARMYVHDYGNEGCSKGVVLGGIDLRVKYGEG